MSLLWLNKADLLLQETTKGGEAGHGHSHGTGLDNGFGGTHYVCGFGRLLACVMWSSRRARFNRSFLKR